VIRAISAENVLRGNKINEKAITEAAEIAAKESKPITDLRSSAEYRKEMVRVLVQRAIRIALQRAEVKN
jgi:carbon-monoxide dehydrogenase medium subunit